MCHPFQIVGAVVALVLVDMVYLFESSRVWHESLSHEAMHFLICGCSLLVEQVDVAVIGLCAEYLQHLTRYVVGFRCALACVADDVTSQRPHPSEVAHLVQFLVAFNVFPDFLG